MKRLLPLIALLFAPVIATAQPDAEADKPYELQVVLRCGAHNWLGKQFRSDLRGDLAGMLADALGQMAEVKVVDLKDTPADQWTPLWKEFEARGFAAMDGAKDIGAGKTHFLRVDFVNGQYEIQARQIDGQTGLVSPWQRERTPDRAFVARLAGKLIAQDFGLIGTVVGRGDDVRLKFRAGQGANIERWVAPGDVFALMQVAPGSGGKERVYPVPDTVVRVSGEAKNGECDAKVVHRAKDNPMEKAANAGFRCIKIGTGRGPMRLRLVDEKGQPHTRTLQLYVHSTAFQDGRQTSDEEVINPERGGSFVSKRNYDSIAFVRIISGGDQIAKVPVTIQEGRETVVQVSHDAAQEQKGQLQAIRADLHRQYNDSVLVQINSYKAVSAMVKRSENVPALERSKAARKALEDDLQRLGAQKTDVKKKLAGSDINVNDCDEAEKDLEGHKVRINRLIGQLEETERIANSPDRIEKKQKLQAANTKAIAAMDSFDFDAAIAIYREMVAENPEETGVKKTLQDLEADWELKSNEHGNARRYVYTEWTGIKSSADLAAKLPGVRAAFQTLLKSRDKLTVLKLHSTLPEIGKVLRDEAAALANTEDGDASGKLKKLVEDFDKFGQEVTAALGAKG